jgi:hypothetical protein
VVTVAVQLKMGWKVQATAAFGYVLQAIDRNIPMSPCSMHRVIRVRLAALQGAQ